MNGTLKISSEWQEARAVVEAAGPRSYYKPPAKSWDALRACNWVDAGGKIRRLWGDAIGSAYADRHFVIEHGAPLDRVLLPGAPVRIFAPQGIDQIVSIATECGFQPTGIIDFRCGETTVQWLGLDYTFIDFSLKRSD